jgi:hypothetical protein
MGAPNNWQAAEMPLDIAAIRHRNLITFLFEFGFNKEEVIKRRDELLDKKDIVNAFNSLYYHQNMKYDDFLVEKDEETRIRMYQEPFEYALSFLPEIMSIITGINLEECTRKINADKPFADVFMVAIEGILCGRSKVDFGMDARVWIKHIIDIMQDRDFRKYELDDTGEIIVIEELEA